MGTKVHITCLCGKSKGTVSVAAHSLPAETLLCHCNICRYTSGLLCVSYLTLEAPPDLKNRFTTYQSSAKMERRFCSVCGSHVFAYNSDLDEWYLAAGLIEMPDPNIEGALMQTTKVVRHEFVADTRDGGLVPCLETIQGRELDLFAQGPDEEPISPTSAYPASTVAALHSGDEKQSDPSRSGDHLHASCHCGGVQFKLSRPNERSSQLSSPWPDLLVPYHSNSPSNDGDIKWWLRANQTKYLAGTCACRPCRLAAGFAIQTWAFVPKANITTRDGRALSFTLGTLEQFKSSPGVYREFCGRCGATVFWHCDERPDLIDVSVGLLRANEGSRAMKWLDWWMERVSFKEDAIDTELMDALESGLPRIGRGSSCMEN
jgi:hypothetical protein